MGLKGLLFAELTPFWLPDSELPRALGQQERARS